MATNKRELLDDGIISRVKQVELKLPDEQMSAAILIHYLERYPHNLSGKVELLTKMMYAEKMSGRDIEYIVNEAYAKSETAGATKVLCGAILDVIAEIKKQKESECLKKEKEEAESKKEKEIRDLQLRALKEDQERRFHDNFLQKQMRREGEYSSQRDFLSAAGDYAQFAKGVTEILSGEK